MPEDVDNKTKPVREAKLSPMFILKASDP